MLRSTHAAYIDVKESHLCAAHRMQHENRCPKTYLRRTYLASMYLTLRSDCAKYGFHASIIFVNSEENLILLTTVDNLVKARRKE